MKKLFGTFICIITILGLTGCGQSSQNQELLYGEWSYLGKSGIDSAFFYYKFNEDGTFANDRKGIKQVALLMKLKITNNGDEDFQFLSNGFRLYCFRYNEQDDATYYSTIESRQSYLNIHDDHEIFRHHLTIKPGETKEVVAMEVIPYEFVNSYTRTTANVGGQYIDTYKDITTDGLTIDSLYTCYSTTDKAFPVGSPIVKLDIDK